LTNNLPANHPHIKLYISDIKYWVGIKVRSVFLT